MLLTSEPSSQPGTYIISPEVGVVLLNAIIQDGDHHSPAGQSLVPNLQNVEIWLYLVVLKQTKMNLGSVGFKLAPVHSAQPKCLPCTTAWKTRGPWAPPRSASPAASESVAQTTAPAEGHGLCWCGMQQEGGEPPWRCLLRDRNVGSSCSSGAHAPQAVFSETAEAENACRKPLGMGVGLLVPTYSFLPSPADSLLRHWFLF